MLSDFSTVFTKMKIYIYIYTSSLLKVEANLFTVIQLQHLSNTVWSLSSWEINSPTPLKGYHRSQVQCLSDLIGEK